MIPHEKLKERMILKGYSYRTLSKTLGIPKSTLYSKLNGRSEFDIVEAGAISSLLDIPPEEIYIFFA